MSFGKDKTAIDNCFSQPESGDDGGDTVDKEHFIKFEDFGSGGPEEKRGEEEEGEKEVADVIFKTS